MLHYEIIGKGKPVVIIHGLSCDLTLMKGCMEPIFGNLPQYKRIYIDLPGMGQSSTELENATADKMLEILVNFIKENVQKNFLLIGQSYGGYLVRGILSEFKEKVDGMMLICPVIVPNKDKRLLPTNIIKFEDTNYLSTLDETERIDFCEFAIIANEKTHERYKMEILQGLQRANAEFIDRLCENYEFSFDVDIKIRNMKYSKPVLFLLGRQDDCVGYADTWKILEDYKRATFAIIDVAGHNLQIEQPRLFNELAWNWLERVENFQ